jgi:hypothetical protein
MLLRNPGFYRFGVGINIPTSSQDLASNRALYLPKMGKNHQKSPKIRLLLIKNPKTIEKNPYWKKFGCTTPFLRAPSCMRFAMWPRANPPRLYPLIFDPWSLAWPYGLTLSSHTLHLVARSRFVAPGQLGLAPVDCGLS